MEKIQMHLAMLQYFSFTAGCLYIIGEGLDAFG